MTYRCEYITEWMAGGPLKCGKAAAFKRFSPRGTGTTTLCTEHARLAPVVELSLMQVRPCDECGGDATYKPDGTPTFPASHGSTVGLCAECARESISL